MTQAPTRTASNKEHTRIAMLHLIEERYFTAMVKLQLQRIVFLISQLQRLISWHAADEPSDKESPAWGEWSNVMLVLSQRQEVAYGTQTILQRAIKAAEAGHFLPDYQHGRDYLSPISMVVAMNPGGEGPAEGQLDLFSVDLQ